MATLKATWGRDLHDDRQIIGVIKLDGNVIWRTEKSWPIEQWNCSDLAKAAAVDHLSELFLFLNELMSATR